VRGHQRHGLHVFTLAHRQPALALPCATRKSWFYMHMNDSIDSASAAWPYSTELLTTQASGSCAHAWCACRTLKQMQECACQQCVCVHVCVRVQRSSAALPATQCCGARDLQCCAVCWLSSRSRSRPSGRLRRRASVGSVVRMHQCRGEHARWARVCRVWIPLGLVVVPLWGVGLGRAGRR
jgi:hypothetical protein